jgi:GTP cyclohydrolase I
LKKKAHLDNETNRIVAQDMLRQLIEMIGEDPHREGLKDTPKRIVSAWRELFEGYNCPIETFLTTFDAENATGMIVEKGVQFHSMCEHHMLPFYGVVNFGYIPGSRIVGLSKIPRLIEVFSRRMQVQERMTLQILNAFTTHVKPKGCIVQVSASHMCMACRGVKQQTAKTITCEIYGDFESPEVRSEFFSHLQS